MQEDLLIKLYLIKHQMFSLGMCKQLYYNEVYQRGLALLSTEDFQIRVVEFSSTI